MLIISMIFTVSIIAMVLFCFLIVFGIHITKNIKIVLVALGLISFCASMFFASLTGKLDRLEKDKIQQYEKITFTVYKKI